MVKIIFLCGPAGCPSHSIITFSLLTLLNNVCRLHKETGREDDANKTKRVKYRKRQREREEEANWRPQPAGAEKICP